MRALSLLIVATATACGPADAPTARGPRPLVALEIGRADVAPDSVAQAAPDGAVAGASPPAEADCPAAEPLTVPGVDATWDLFRGVFSGPVAARLCELGVEGACSAEPAPAAGCESH